MILETYDVRMILWP